MNRIDPSILLILSLCLASPVLAQTDSVQTDTLKSTYFEPLEDGRTQFYFDEHYFLVDRDCQYKTIERVGKYNVSLKNFDGPFTDYNNDGQVILTGNYTGGKKNGLFTAYFANGRTKWIIHFKDDLPVDTSKYNYPDGLPLLEIRYTDSAAYVQNFWDTHRRQRIKDGDGKFEFAVKAEGYNAYGYTYTKYQGNVKAGKPDGVWNIFLLYDNREQDFAGYERFEKGKFKAGYDELEGVPYQGNSKLQIGPSLFFPQAEEMVSKHCTIDENQDFSLFMVKKLEKAFALFDVRDLIPQPTELEITAHVDKSGTLQQLELVKGLPSEEADKIIRNTLRNINYWIPSYGDGDYIDDVLQLKADVIADENGRLKCYNLMIEREKGI
ncbi:hypothetical protein GCM10023231_08790 [Olivibacter ginsenosidimutans]|uniref:MORN repeat variant n=1 Tax=Olivibacter ginsenosidimutans TaxID=1176537 RepID=A0ABP9AM11_9SPHI